MDKGEAFEAFDGAMLSDSQLIRSHNSGNAYFNLSQSGYEHMDWLIAVEGALAALGIKPCEGYPKILSSVSKGVKYDYCRLDTKVSELLTVQYYRWYPESSRTRGDKIVPKDLKLTPLSLAHWFMGDGSAFISTKTVRGYVEDSVGLAFASAGFDEESITILEQELGRLDLTKLRRQKDRRVEVGSGINLVTQSKAEINRVICLVEPYVVPSFRYKCVHPQYRVNFRKTR